MRGKGIYLATAILAVVASSSVVAQSPADSPAPKAQDKSSGEKKSSGGEKTQAKNSGKCMRTMMRCCADRAKSSVSTIDGVMTSLDKAGGSNDPEQMKAAIENAKKELAELKAEHNKSYHLLEAATKHLEKIRKQANSKTKQLIDESDPSWDDVIWAF